MRKPTRMVKKLYAVVKIHMQYAAPTLSMSVNQLIILSAVNMDTVTVVENAGPIPSHAVTPQLSTVNTNMMLALNTAAVTTQKLAVKRERNVSHTTISAVSMMKKNAMVTVFQRMTTAVITELNGVNTHTNVKNQDTVVNHQPHGVNILTNVKNTAAHTQQNGVNILMNALNIVATQIHLTATTLILVRNTAVNTTTRNMMSGVISMKNAEMNVTVAMMDTKLASVTVELTMLILHALLKTLKNAVNTSGVKKPTNAFMMNSNAVKPKVTPT